MAFKCNLQECEERLGKSLGYCDCGHVFCAQHSKEWFSAHNTCPLCGEKVRVRWADFTTERERALVGCSPEAMLRALEEGMRFWTLQKELERGQREEREKKGVSFLREKLREAEKVIQSLQSSLHQGHPLPFPSTPRPPSLPAVPATPCLFSPPPNSHFPN